MNGWVLLSLLIAHVIGDFYLQSNKYCKLKEKNKFRSPFLYIHSFIVGALSWVFVPGWSFGIYAAVIFLTHLLTDAIKTYAERTLWAFMTDQTVHVIILVIVSCLYTTHNSLPVQYLDFTDTLSIPLLLFAVLCCLKPANILIKQVLEQYKIGEAESCNSMKNAGALIGNLERVLTLAFVILGQYEAVGFIVAAKTLLRFKDTDTAKTEYVLAGTLLSVGISILFGVAVKLPI